MKDKIMKILFLIVATIIIIIAIVNVAKQNSSKQQIQDIAENKEYIYELRIGISSFDTLDPIYSSNKNVQDVGKLIYEPLVTLDENYKAKGVLADEWAKTSDSSYIIKLKQGVKFSDGKEFIATDVENTINKIKESNNSIYKDNIKNIANINVIDNYTIKIDLKDNEVFFEYNLIFPIQHINEAEVNKVLGTGLYKVFNINSNKIELIRNSYNIHSENSKMKTIIIKKYDTVGELYNDFKIGNLDIINTDKLDYSKYIGTLGYIEKSFYGRNFLFIAFNLSNSSLYNIEVRKAISYAIDKNAIIQNIYNNKYFVSNFPLDYGNWVYNDNNTSSGFNPEQSKNILESNGWILQDNIWRKNNLKLEFNLIVNSRDSLRSSVAENIKQQLEKVGIKINIIKVGDTNSYINNSNYDMALLEMKIGTSPNLTTFFGNSNIFNYNNEELVYLIEELKGINDENIIKERYLKMLDIYKTDLPFISLCFSNSVIIYNSKIAGNIEPTWFNLYYNIENWIIEK